MTTNSGSDNVKQPIDGLAFRLLSVERHPPPAGGDGKDWFQYKIAQGDNIITGCRRGALAAVTDEVRKVVEALNERRGSRRGRVNLVMQPPAQPPRARSGSG